MNSIGPVLVYICLLFNLYAVIYFYVFPLNGLLDSDDVFISIYLLLFIMTIWSFIAASCTDPGYVPRDLTNYDSAKLSKRELLLWNYIENLGLDPNNDSIQQDDDDDDDADEKSPFESNEEHEQDNSESNGREITTQKQSTPSVDSKDPLQFLVTRSLE